MISSVIITLNEEEHIERCIRSIVSFSDEVIVVDTGSSDKTVETAKACGARVDIIKWQGYGHARDHGAHLATHDWIFSIDADEYCSKELQVTISKLHPIQEHIYQVRRINYYKGQPMTYGALHPELKVRLYKKDIASWTRVSVHETLLSDGNLQKIKLQGVLHHQLADTYQDHLNKLMHYAQLTARDKTYPWGKGLSPYYHFIKSYIFQLGMLEGRAGWETSIAAMKYRQWQIKKSF